MSKHLDISSLGEPTKEQRHRSTRRLASLVAAIAGGAAVMVAGFLIIGGGSAITNVWAWLLLATLVAVWASGIWWRWDSPALRRKGVERERRGF